MTTLYSESIDNKCCKCIFPKNCVNLGMPFCNTKSLEIKFNFVEQDGKRAVSISDECRCSRICFECKYDKTCLASENYKKEGETNDTRD